jgi:hypothetical protein
MAAKVEGDEHLEDGGVGGVSRGKVTQQTRRCAPG